MDAVLVEKLRASLQREPDILFAYLFGSAGRGDAIARSDVDVAVYLRPGPPLDVLSLMSRVEGVGRRHLDFVILNTAPLALAYETLKGHLLFSRDEGVRVEVESALTHRYLDRAWYMRRHLEEFAQHMLERGYS